MSPLDSHVKTIFSLGQWEISTFLHSCRYLSFSSRDFYLGPYVVSLFVSFQCYDCPVTLHPKFRMDFEASRQNNATPVFASDSLQ